jgi:hypothetical protein
VEGAHRGEVHVREDVAVQHEHRAAREVGRVAHAAARSQGLGLDGVPEAHAEMLGLAERAADVVDPVRAGEHDVGDAVLAEEGQLPGEERPVQDGDDGLGTCERERAEARALTTREDDGLGCPR